MSDIQKVRMQNAKDWILAARKARIQGWPARMWVLYMQNAASDRKAAAIPY